MTQDMDLLNEQRSLIHTGRLIRPDNGNTWMELFVMLFDNYCELNCRYSVLAFYSLRYSGDNQTSRKRRGNDVSCTSPGK
jgi:hypothetical protein